MGLHKHPTPSDGNELYPLPPDYAELSESGQREARVAACRQWTLWDGVGDRPMKARAFVSGIHFFDTYYLQMERDEDGSVVFDPMFYRDWLPPPPGHDLIYSSMMLHRRVAGVGPRGYAKSFALAKSIMFPMLVVPNWENLYATSTNDLAEKMGDRTKYQLYENKRIFDDWAPEYGGHIKPRKSEGKMGMNSYMLSNRSSFVACSAQARQRGHRPTRYKLDDPEYDPSGSTSMQDRRDYMEWLIFSIALPMVQAPNTGIDWWGTFVSRQHYLYHAMQTNLVTIDGREVEVAKERRFGKWMRIEIPVEDQDPVTGQRVSCWPHMWPASNEEREELGKECAATLHAQTLSDVEEEVGPEIYNREYRHKPGTASNQHFKDLTKDQHGYWFENPDGLLATTPHLSRTTICWMRDVGDGGGVQTIRLPLCDFLRRFSTFTPLDTSWTHNPSSDFKVAAVMCVADAGELFILDLWAEQCPEPRLVDEAFVIADRWHSSLHPEMVDAGINLNETILARVRMRASEVFDSAGNRISLKFLPFVRGFKPGFTSKEARIAAALTWRIDHNKIKVPWHLYEAGVGPWRMLKDQLCGFNPHVAGGGLEHDDLIDGISMHTQVVGGRSVSEKKEEKKESTPIQRLKDGETVDEYGQSLLALAIPNMTSEQVRDVIAARAEPRSESMI